MLYKTAIAISALLILAAIPQSFASTGSGSMKEVVSNERMQIYVLEVKEEYGEGPNKRVDIEVIMKNIEPGARVFNVFFVRIIDSDGNEQKASPLLGTIMPVRIPSNDIQRGVLVFSVPRDAALSTLVWKESEGPLAVDLTRSKSPPDPAPRSDWTLSSNKGRVLSDGRTELSIHDELLNKSPPYYLIDISIKDLSDAPIDYSVVYSFVKDQDGNLYPPDLRNFHLMKNPLQQGALNPGQEVRGEVLFLLPDTVTAVMFIYDEKLGGESYLVAPEFPYHVAILIAALGSSIALARLATRRKGQMMMMMAHYDR